jgi:phospholipid/cholesterol/gamma-HCH transport system substrate-binding protein
LNNNVKIKDDDIASIRTKGIIGDRYVKISRGGSDTYIAPEGTIVETESVVDLEDVIGKLIHNFTGEKDEEKGSSAEKSKDDKKS